MDLITVSVFYFRHVISNPRVSTRTPPPTLILTTVNVTSDIQRQLADYREFATLLSAFWQHLSSNQSSPYNDLAPQQHQLIRNVLEASEILISAMLLQNPLPIKHRNQYELYITIKVFVKVRNSFITPYIMTQTNYRYRYRVLILHDIAIS